MGCCCSTPPNAVDDEDAPKTKKEDLRSQKVRLNMAVSSDGIELDVKVKSKGMRGRGRAGVVGGIDVQDDEDFDPQSVDASAAAEAAAEAEAAAAAAAAAAAEAEAAAAAAAAEEEARMAEAAAKARAEAEAAAHAAKLNASLATRIASNKPKTRAQMMHTAAALELSDGAAFGAFIKWEDQVQAAAAALLGDVPRKKLKKARGASGEGNLFTLLAMEEQTRNSSFVAALQTQNLSRPLQGKALRAYCMLLDNVLTKLTRRLPTMPKDVAPLVSSYLSALSQHRDLAKAAQPHGFVQ